MQRPETPPRLLPISDQLTPIGTKTDQFQGGGERRIPHCPYGENPILRGNNDAQNKPAKLQIFSRGLRVYANGGSGGHVTLTGPAV